MKYNKNLKSIYITLLNNKLIEWKTGLYGKERKDIAKNLYVIHKAPYGQRMLSFYDLYITILNEFDDCTIPKTILKQVLKNEQDQYSPVNNKVAISARSQNDNK